MELPQREILELEAQLRRDERVGLLLGGQLDVESDRLAAHVEGAAIRGLHDAGPATGDDHVVALVLALVVDRHDPGELAGVVIVAAEVEQPPGEDAFQSEPAYQE